MADQMADQVQTQLVERGVVADEAPVDAASQPATPEPLLTPFGAGAPLPANRGHLPTARQTANAQRATQQAAEWEVRAAGDRAEAMFPAWDQNEDYPSYIRRRALVRGAAEKDIIDRQYVERRARELAEASAVVSRPAPWRAPQVRGVQRVQPAQQAPAAVVQPAAVLASVAPAASTPSAPETPAPQEQRADMAVGSALQTEKPNAAIVPTGPIPSPSLGAGGQGGTTRHSHSHTHPHATSSEAHVHDTQHTHEDGTQHSHPHRHDHAHDDHGDEHTYSQGVANRAGGSGDSGDHSHLHFHPHDHTHVYRAGAPTDAALVLAEETRLAEERARASVTLQSTAPTPVKPLASIKPASGSAMYQSDEVSKPKSPQMNVHPQEVGHLDLLNTEDANATTFGVPPEVQIEATPADGQVAAPVGFLEGGHMAGNLTNTTGLSPANKDFAPSLAAQKTAVGPLHHDDAPDPNTPLDQDLDHDAAEDAAEIAAAKAGSAGTLPGLDQGARPTTGNAAIIHESDKTPARAARAVMPEADESGEMDDDLDHDADEDGAEAGEATAIAKGGSQGKSGKSRRTVDEVDEERVGARVSAESRQALHAVREGQLAQIKTLCDHCRCDECQQYTDALDEMARAAREPEAPPSPEAVARLAEVFGRQRLLADLVQHGVRAETERLTQQVEALLARTHDLELTLAAQAQASAQARHAASADTTTLTRMQEAEDARFVAFRAQLDTDLATSMVAALTQAISPIAQRMEAVASLGPAVDALKADVERIAAQPVSSGGPVVGLADKRLPFSPDALQAVQAGPNGTLMLGSASPTAPTGSTLATGNPNDYQTQIAALQAVARNTRDVTLQMALAQQVAQLEALANGGRAPTRSMIGGTTPAAAAAAQVLGARDAYRRRNNGGN